jgi:predicted transcriptional regulator
MKNKSLIDVFESKLSQDVKTFNLIFKQTKIKDYPSDASVEIKELHAGDKRRIVIGENKEEILLKIVQIKRKRKRKKKEKQYILKQVTAINSCLPDVFMKLKPSEFMVFQAIKLLDCVDSIEELSKQMCLNRKTISQVVQKLIKMNMIRTEKVAVDGQPSLRLHLTQPLVNDTMVLQ